MLKKMSFFSAVIVLSSLCLTGVAFAAQGNNIATEAGNYEYHFDGTSINSSERALTNDYDAERLANVGNEAGNWKFSFDNSNTSSDQIASEYDDYSLEKLTDIGAEAGSLEYNEMGLKCETC